jgi:glycosyltransferase involved in cell wall biosynthesis
MCKLRVLLAIDEASLGGGQTHVLLLAKYLDRANFEVEIATKETGWLVDEVRKLGAIVHPIDITNNLSWKSYQSVRQLFIDRNFDVVHTHGGTAGFWMRLGAIGLNQKPILIHTYHGLHYLNFSQISNLSIFKQLKGTIFKQIDRLLLEYTDRVICVCHSDYDKAIAAAVAIPDRTSIVYNGIEIDKFTNSDPKLRDRHRKLIGIEPTDFVFGNVGRLHVQKGHKFLLQAFVNVNCRARLAIVGDGELRDELAALADRLQISDRVLFLGARADVAEFLSVIDVFVLPSLWEGQPIALLEALAIGKPCIVSNIDGIPEIIENGVNGYLVNPRDIQELARMMNLAIEYPELMQKFPDREVSAIDPKFFAQNMATEIANLYLFHTQIRSNSDSERSGL